jgi:tetratricopeptide (TPR) repeat protein
MPRTLCGSRLANVRGMRTTVLFAAALASLVPVTSLAAGPGAPPSHLVITPLDTEPKGAHAPRPDELAADAHEVDQHPDDRGKRLALVRGLLAAKQLDAALMQARAWRGRDAYNLVAVRALGDVLMDRGEKEDAERVYSSIVELLPRDPDAQRALATLLKQRGDLPASRERLLAAVDGRPGDSRLLFELADVELRLGETDSATERLEKVAAASDTPPQIRFPAKQRLGQVFGEARRKAKQGGAEAKVKDLTARIDGLGLKGGLENDIHVYLTWDTDRTDVDLWVTTPRGEKVFYQHKEGAAGESLFDDVTTGYGPESFTAKDAQRGDYLVQVNYYSARRSAFPEARGEVVIVLDEGRAEERKQVLPYRLFAEKETVDVARVHVGGAS